MDNVDIYAKKAVESGAVKTEQDFYKMYISGNYEYPEEFVGELKQEYLKSGASSIVGKKSIEFAFDNPAINSIGRKPIDGNFVTSATEDANLIYDGSGAVRDYKEIAQMKGISEGNLADGVYQYEYDSEFIKNCNEKGLFNPPQGTNEGSNILNIPGGRTYAGSDISLSQTEMICPPIDVSMYSSKNVMDAIKTDGEFVITNPSVYLSDGKTTVIEGTFTIRKLN